MRKCARATWILTCVLASIMAITAIQAQEEETAQTSEETAPDTVPVPSSKPTATSKAKSFLQKIGNAVNSFRGGTSSAETARDNAPVEFSRDLVGYLQRTVRDRQSEIDRRKQNNGAKPKPAVKPKIATSKTSGNRTISRKQFAELLGSLDKAEAELAQLNLANGQQPPAAAEPKIRTLLDTPYIGTVYVSSNKYVRFFVAQLVVVNSTAKPVVVKRSELQLTADGKIYKSGTLSSRVKSHSYTAGSKSVYLGNLKFPAEVTIPAGDNGSMWVVFENLPVGGNVPTMSLNMQLAGRPAVLKVNDFARSVMGLTVERIGPQGSLGLLTIAGSMNMINIGGLVDELDTLTADKVIRVVIRWEKSAPQLDSQIGSWLKQQAQQSGQNQQINNSNNRFPIIPAAIRELHLANVPSQSGGTTYYSSYGRNAPNKIHKTVRAAVTAAMRTAFEVLSRDQLLHEIDEGHPLIRSAALACGGGRLSSDDLPLILEYANGEAVDMQRAALVALRHFGEPEAIAALLTQASLVKEPMADIAIQSLAGSRFSAAQSALLKLLQDASPELKKKIVVIVARHPRPIWSDVVYEFATADDSEVNIVALQALVRIGHPRLVDVLGDSLHQGTRSFQEAAFKILALRTDSRSEELAMQYALDRMERSPPTSEVIQLLQRTRDRRAVPLLLAHFEKSKSNRSTILNALALIGDQSVADVFLKQYSSLQTHEKTVVLNMLRQLRSPKFRKLAGDALLSKNSSLINAACQGLQEDGSTTAIAMLVNAYGKTTYTSAWSYIGNALSSLGTDEARAALQKGTRSKNANQRTYAISALRSLRQRSPGYQYIYRAKQFDQQKKWKESAQQYTLAVKMDPQLPDAYSGRGTALLHQDKFKEAGADFEKAIKLDAFNSIALTGLGIVRVREGKTDEGIKLIEGKRKMFENDNLFAYNAACVYGRALEAVKKDKKAADRDKKIAEYQKLALSDLKRSLKLGFRDRDWMKKDPDLKSLHNLDEFKKIHSPDAVDGEEKATDPTPPKAAAAVEPAIAIPVLDLEAP